MRRDRDRRPVPGRRPGRRRAAAWRAAAVAALALCCALEAVAQSPLLGLPDPPYPAGDPPTPATIALGRKLFFDPRLSADGALSCGSCHVPEQGFAAGDGPAPLGAGGRPVRRNAPTILNVAYYDRLFQDGREATLEAQAWSPLLAADEMANPSADAVVARIAALPDYAGLFEAAFAGAGPGRETIGRALAAYQRSLLSGGSRFDRWWFGGERDAVTAEERAGFVLFLFRGGCAQCHAVGERGALFTDQRFHNTGTGQTPADLGRMEVTGDAADRWKYRTPGLRNVALTAPYMHDGSLATLEDVVAFYDRGGGADPAKAEWLYPLRLSAADRRALVAFLKTLTGANADALAAEARR
jgi:cytochrome c peroxidase